ncbi:MAG TPA: NAD-dependent epimerase/dehydratase family protein [Steroidobacteraceae bacterium]|nr:NAD-dependent epimerase/dehydratase family protein [Steroidobacteraceae bacterium]
MKVLVIGSEGFIGQALVARLLAGDQVGEGGQSATQVTLLDMRIAPRAADPRVRAVEGDICDRAVLNRAIEGGVDCVFHLASIPGGAAEQNFELGLKVNLYATLDMLEVLRLSGQKPRVVFASTIGIYGVPLPEVIDELTIPEPSLSYGAQKLIGEILVSDYARKGFISGVSVRIPGIVARPPSKGMLSIFLSDIIRELSAGRSFVCPVAADGPSWWMSRPCIVQNLLHASALGDAVLSRQRSFLMPVLRLTLGEVVAGIARLHGKQVLERVSYQPDARLQAQFANLPLMRCPKSEAAGFRHDGTVENLVTRALAPL